MIMLIKGVSRAQSNIYEEVTFCEKNKKKNTGNPFVDIVK